jgi:hypothetical protein
MITDVDEMIQRLGLQNTITRKMVRYRVMLMAVDPDFKMPQVWKSSLAFGL